MDPTGHRQPQPGTSPGASGDKSKPDGQKDGQQHAQQPPPLHALPPGSELRGVDAALDEMGIGIFEWDGDAATRKYVFSPRCYRIWGLSEKTEMTREEIVSRVHPDDVGMINQISEAIGPGGCGHYAVEFRIVQPDGTVRWLRVSAQLHFIGEGPERHALRGYGALCDITDRKLAELALEEQSAQMLIFVQRAPVPVAMFDRDMRYIAASDRFAEQWGIPKRGLQGRCHHEVFPHLPKRWLEVHRRVLLEGATESSELDEHEWSDGRRDFIRWRMRPWYDDKGLCWAILFAEIITPHIQMQQALRESQARLELALQASAFGVYDRDLTLGHTEWDARAREMFGVGPHETITPEMYDGLIHPDDRGTVAGAVPASLAAGSGILELEFRIINRKDGTLRWIASTGRTWIEDAHIRAIGVFQDITERKRAELALQQLTQELRRADEHKDLYLATLSHELRNPLAPIRTAAHLLGSPRLPPEDLRWMSQLIRRQTAHMASLLEDLLEITRISHGKLTLRREHTPLSAITQPALESAGPLIEEKRHQLIVDLPGEPLTVYGDPARLAQVLSNLLTNAAKYTNPGGRIELSVRIEGDQLVIRVKDNGIGVSPENLEQMFRLFWQADGAAGRARGGLGIGLSFVQGIVQLHRGTIAARSGGLGQGCEITVRLPRDQVTASSAVRAQSTPSAAAGQHRILVADDDNDTADTLEMLLTLSGHQVRVAHSGLDAVQTAREFRPDVALLDLSMPDLDGYAVASTLRGEPWAERLRLIALTGWGQPDGQRRALDAGFHEQLLKPVDPDRLRQLL